MVWNWTQRFSRVMVQGVRFTEFDAPDWEGGHGTPGIATQHAAAAAAANGGQRKGLLITRNYPNTDTSFVLLKLHEGLLL